MNEWLCGAWLPIVLKHKRSHKVINFSYSAAFWILLSPKFESEEFISNITCEQPL